MKETPLSEKTHFGCTFTGKIAVIRRPEVVTLADTSPLFSFNKPRMDRRRALYNRTSQENGGPSRPANPAQVSQGDSTREKAVSLPLSVVEECIPGSGPRLSRFEDNIRLMI